ncbi:putative kinesin family protein [Peziza echinospora]|nr:putative kinesin family protein [Peziza echinospora]
MFLCLAMNLTDTSKRETLAERAAKPSGIAPPKIKPIARPNSTVPSTSTKQLMPRPKSSMDRVRPTNGSVGGGGGMTRSLSNSGKGGFAPRPPSAQEIRSVGDDEILMGSEFNRRLKQLEEALKGVNMASKNGEKDEYREKYETERMRVMELETARATMESQLTFTKMELEQTKMSLLNTTRALDDERRERRTDKDDTTRKYEREFDEIKRRAKDEVDSVTQQQQAAMDSITRQHQNAFDAQERTFRDTLESAERAHREAIESLERRLKQQIEDERAQRIREVNEAHASFAAEKSKIENKMDSKWREIRMMKEELETVNRDLERERVINSGLRDNLTEQTTSSLSTETTIRTLKARMEMLEVDSKEKLHRMLELEAACRAAQEETASTKEKLRVEETLRRKLHNQVQELKGNIRVFCRVRPTIGPEAINAAELRFPDIEHDAREIEVVGPSEKSALGNVTVKTHPFQFDRVFGPTCQNADVFEEISQLIQSALDGYNVCIFCYGQTGSGKTFTMSSKDGMIPRAVHQIYDTAKGLEDKGWQYVMEGSFVEVYNENINDLLGKADDLDKKKHEIRHDPKELKTTVTGLTSVVLDAPSRVEQLLRTADANRSVAATKANERSSRSHSVFMLKLTGYNSVTGEKSEGTLNLVDLAGSERLSHSQASGDRLKETQSINKSLACLGDVIGALGSGKDGAHIPYRNSKLTYLLQYSLGGNSKTLMFVMVSPMQAHLSESLTSLKFATKVANTYIGTARKKITAG